MCCAVLSLCMVNVFVYMIGDITECDTRKPDSAENIYKVMTIGSQHHDCLEDDLND